MDKTEPGEKLTILATMQGISKRIKLDDDAAKRLPTLISFFAQKRNDITDAARDNPYLQQVLITLYRR